MDKESDINFIRNKAFDQSDAGLTLPLPILYKRLLTIDPKCSIAYCDLAILSLNQKNYSRTEKLLKRSIEIDPNYIEVYFNLGICYSQQKKSEEAAKAFQKVIDRDPNDAQAYCELAGCLFEQGLRDRAFAAFEQAINIDPTDTSVYNNYGQRLIHSGDYSRALEQFRIVFATDPYDVVANNNTGLIFLIKGRYEEAVEYFKIATDHEDNIDDGMRDFALINWSMVEFQQGNKEEALELFEIGMKVATHETQEIIQIFKCTHASLLKKILVENDIEARIGIQKTIKSFEYVLGLLENERKKSQSK